MVKWLNIGKNISQPIYRSISSLNSLVLNYCSTTVDTNATAPLVLSWFPAKMSEFRLRDVNRWSSIVYFYIDKCM